MFKLRLGGCDAVHYVAVRAKSIYSERIMLELARLSNLSEIVRVLFYQKLKSSTHINACLFVFSFKVCNTFRTCLGYYQCLRAKIITSNYGKPF